MILIKDIANNVILTVDEFKAMNVTVDTGAYQMIYLIERNSILESAQELTAIRARFATGENGTPLLDIYALREDDTNLVARWMRDAGKVVFSAMSAWAKGIDSAYRANVDVDIVADPKTITTVVDGDYMMFSYGLDPKQDPNIWESIERDIQSAIERKVVAEWYYINRYMDDFMLEKQVFDTLVGDLRSNLIKTVFPYRRPISPV